MSVIVHLWGPFACFTRPEVRAERVSYDVITPSAARGILDSIYWHEGIKWEVQDIYVRKPVKFLNIRRNELKGGVPARAVMSAISDNGVLPVCDTNGQRTQRASRILKDVDYYIRACYHVDGNAYDGPEAKAAKIIMTRLSRGKCYSRPYFGCREYEANFELVDEIPPCPPELQYEADLSWTLFDRDYDNPKNDGPDPRFYRPVMKDGHIMVPGRGELL